MTTDTTSQTVDDTWEPGEPYWCHACNGSGLPSSGPIEGSCYECHGSGVASPEGH